jgi:small subunit ribosomal protein S15
MESASDNTGKRTTGQVTSEDLAVGTLRLAERESLDVVKQFQRNSQDCGSPEVQIALLTRRLEVLTSHFGKFPKDHHSRKGMMDIISRRKRMLQYLKREDVARYRSTIAALGLRK